MNWKLILKTLITPLLALVYTYLQSQHPDFPWTSSDFIEQALWLISVAIGGWQTKLYFINKKYTLRKK